LTGGGAGKTAHYMLHWVSTTGEKGPWSETAGATIGAYMTRVAISLAVSIITTLLVGGCENGNGGVVADQPNEKPKPEKRARIDGYYEVEVISDPPGARIEVNDDYVGDAPLTIRMKGDRKGRVKQDYVVRALPTVPGHHVQTKFFWHSKYIDSDTIPRRILFQMYLVPVPREMNVNIRHE
jgi:hypothetical protein